LEELWDVMIAFMSTDHIVALLVLERAKLNRAIEALQAGAKTDTPEIGVAPGGWTSSGQPSKKRVISAATRRKMALGQRKRYAAVKRAATT
jgi:hypothetical protein